MSTMDDEPSSVAMNPAAAVPRIADRQAPRMLNGSSGASRPQSDDISLFHGKAHDPSRKVGAGETAPRCSTMDGQRPAGLTADFGRKALIMSSCVSTQGAPMRSRQ